ncbi:MAG: hypothetical protein ACPGPS_11355 [Rubripirellula sp.]
MIEQTQSRRIQTRTRAGSLVIECVIASVILASCSIALVKWTQSANQLKRQANTHTAAVLIADNAKQRLKKATLANAAAFVKDVESDLSKPQGFEVTISHTEFNDQRESGSAQRGLHFKITVSQEETPIAVAHCWNLLMPDNVPPSGNDPAGTSATTTEQDGGPVDGIE